MADSEIELADVWRVSETTDDRKRLKRKKDHVTIVDDDHFGVGSESPGIEVLSASTHVRPSAAVFAMDEPSIRDVIAPSSDQEDGPTSVKCRNNCFDVCSVSVPANACPKSNANTSRSTGNVSGTGSAKQDSFDDSGSDQQQRAEESEENTQPRGTKKVIISLSIVAMIAATWTGATQFAKSSLSDTKAFNAPYFLVWFNTNWMAVCFPFYVFLMAVVLACFRNKPSHAKSPYRVICNASLVFGPSGITLKAVVVRSVPFTALWIVANYSYSQALAHISAAETTTVFSSNLAFVYLLSWIFLHDAFVALRILAMLLAIVGIVLMVHAEGLGSMTFVGVVCAVVAAAVSAIYKVLFKKVIGDANFGQVSLFMTMLGLCNLLLSWPIALILILTDAETVTWDLVPWPDICASAVLSLFFNLFVNVGIAYTHPVYISIGLFLGLPLNAAVDAIWRKETLNDLQIVGSVCIVVSFLLLMLPEDFASSILRWLGITRHHRDAYIITRPEAPQTKRGVSLS